MYSIGVTYWYRCVCFDFSPQEGNICATNREHSWNNFGTWPPQKRSVFGTVSWHFMKTATNRELLPPQIGNISDFISKNWQNLLKLHGFDSFLFTSLLPYLLLVLHFCISWNPFRYSTSEAYRHKKGTFLRDEASTFGTKMEHFRFSLPKTACLCLWLPCWFPLPGPYSPQHRCSWDCIRKYSCRRLLPCWAPRTGV